MRKPKRWFWVWEADRITGLRVGGVVKIKAVSVAQACNIYRHKFHEGQPFEALDNLIVASEEGSGVNPALDPPSKTTRSDFGSGVNPAQVLPTAAARPTAKPQAPPAEEKQEELDLGPEFALPPKAQSSGSFSPS